MKKYAHLARKLRGIRGKKSQSDFAKKLGVPLRTYRRYEAGESDLPSDVLIKAARIGRTSVDWILTGLDLSHAAIEGHAYTSFSKTIYQELCRAAKAQGLELPWKTHREFITFEDGWRDTLVNEGDRPLLELVLCMREIWLEQNPEKLKVLESVLSALFPGKPKHKK